MPRTTLSATIEMRLRQSKARTMPELNSTENACWRKKGASPLPFVPFVAQYPARYNPKTTTEATKQ